MALRVVRNLLINSPWRCIQRVVTCFFERSSTLIVYLFSSAVTVTLIVVFFWSRNATIRASYVNPFLSSRNSQTDTETYRRGYPSKVDNPSLNDNYKFYSNEIPSRPDGDLIETIHAKWWGQYEKLERHHGYIQWLFPIREQGLNGEAQELQLHEAKRISSDPVMHGRVLKSYELMLDFYGMKLKDKNTGEIERADNWKERFRHLNHSSHNYLRITRILKCLGEMKYEHLKAPFLRFVLHEAIVEGTLDHTLDSCINYWIEVVKDDKERNEMKNVANKLQSKETAHEL